MVGESKILTVSYGTFSCTLEGFDDSFSTMKAIAEYFKGLAADDRYFGAEPPVPDAEMLMRIAEREVHSRVEAQIGESGIVLRKSDSEEAEAPAIAPAEKAPVESPTRQEPAQAAPEPEILQKEATKAAPVAPAFSAPPENGDAESVAAKLQRIRAVVSRAPSDAALEPIEDANTQDLLAPIESAFRDITPQEDVPAKAPVATPVAEEVEAEFEEEFEEQAFEAEDETAEIDVASDVEAEAEIDVASDVEAEAEIADEDMSEVEVSAEAEAAADDSEDAPEAEVSPVAESAEAAHDNTEADAELPVEDTPEMSEETQAQDDAQNDADDENEASVLAGVGAFMAQSDEGTLKDDTVDAYTNEQGDAPIEASDISSILGAIASQDEGEADDTEAVMEEPAGADIMEETEEYDSLATSVEVTEEILFEGPSEEDLADLERLDGPADTLGASEDDAPEEVAETSDDDDVRVPKGGITSVAARARARVIRVKKADLAEAVENDTVEEFLDNTNANTSEDTFEKELATETGADHAPNSGLSDQDEADLIAELAAVEQEASDIPTVDPLPEVTPHRSLSKEADEDNVNRLMQESESKFAETEGTRRRSAISHLKAAVAATVADRKLLGGFKPKTEDATGAYRQDLADVVRPSRAERRLGSKDDRPAPLVLVSEQRIDLQDGPAVRPRRIRKPAPDLRDVNEDLADGEAMDPKKAKHLAESKSFAEFAERVGATELPDLLEAAAAYASFVEGKEHFSRPEVMRRVLQFGEDQGVTREEGLRSFGLLLRQGKIEKVRRGQFKVSETTRFNPEARIAGE